MPPRQAEAGADVVSDRSRWRDRLAERSGRHADVSVAGAQLHDHLRPLFGPSVATFQLGESGTGEHLLAAARRAGAPVDHVEALRLFVVEEQEHARLLGLVLDELAMPYRRTHWSDRVFVAIRRLHSLRTEVLVLLVAEVIALTYYAALRDGMTDPLLRDVFARIRDDEVVHVEFHGDTLPEYLEQLPGPLLALARLAWSGLVTAASVAVALDHGRLLHALGLPRRRFLRRVWGDRRDLSRRLFGL